MTAERALAHLRRGDVAAALAALDPDDAASQAIRGMALLADDRPADALTALRAAAAWGDDRVATWLNLAIAEDRAGDPVRARALMHDLALRCPDWDEPLLRLAESLRARNEMAAAEQAYGLVLERNPRRPEALIALAGLLLLRGDAAGAQPLLLRCCGIAPERAEAWHALGLALLRTAEPALAHTAFREAQRRAPFALNYALQRVQAAIHSNQAAADLAALTIEADADPLNPVSRIAMGQLLEHLGRRSEAIEAYEIAAALAPDDAMPAGFLAEALCRTTRLPEAEVALRHAIDLAPHNPRLRNDLGATLMRMHRHGEARTLLQSALDEHGEDARVLCNLANTTCCLGLQHEAVALAQRAIALTPDALTPRRSLVSALSYCDGVPGTAVLAAARSCAERLQRIPMQAFANAPVHDRPLKVGLLSGALKTHPVGWLTIAGLEALDPARFQLIALAQSSWGDAIARRFRAVAQAWHEVDRLDDAALAGKARELGIDLLIELGGYGDASRIAACALRLAPVQIKWVGMQSHSTGLPEMDWMLTDRWETPAELAHLYSERLLCLPDGYVCYSPPAYAPDVAPLPALTNGHVTFGCFNNLAKVTPQVIATWARVLHRLPGARLVLKTHQFGDRATTDRVQQAFAMHDIGADRLELRGPSPHRAFIGEYNDIDVVLDPFPYSGGLTTCEALWMGVPTVALAGEIFAARHSTSHLSNVGLTDWVATDVAGYVELALSKVADLSALATLRAGLRARVEASPLCDAPRFGRSLADALRFAWQDWCDGPGHG